MFLKPTKKKVVSTIIIYLTMFVSSLIVSGVQEQVIENKLPIDQIEESFEKLQDFTPEQEKLIEDLTSVNITEVVDNLSDFTEKDQEALKVLIGEDAYKMSEKYIYSVIDDPTILLKDFFAFTLITTVISFLIDIILIYLAVCYLLTYNTKGEAYKKALE